MSNTLDDLLLALAGTPSLPGAKCRHRSALFDEAGKNEPAEIVEQRHAQALSLCRACPALASCQQWFNDLPRAKRPSGVIAGRNHEPSTRRPRKKTAA